MAYSILAHKLFEVFLKVQQMKKEEKKFQREVYELKLLRRRISVKLTERKIVSFEIRVITEMHLQTYFREKCGGSFTEAFGMCNLSASGDASP